MACGHQPAVTTASNHDSLVMAMDDGGINFLLPADIEKKVENELVASTDAFVAAVAPKFAVVSVGDGNPFGHPVDSVVQRYAAAGVRLLRTDQDGEVPAPSEGKELRSGRSLQIRVRNGCEEGEILRPKSIRATPAIPARGPCRFWCTPR